MFYSNRYFHYLDLRRPNFNFIKFVTNKIPINKVLQNETNLSSALLNIHKYYRHIGVNSNIGLSTIKTDSNTFWYDMRQATNTGDKINRVLNNLGIGIQNNNKYKNL